MGDEEDSHEYYFSDTAISDAAFSLKQRLKRFAKDKIFVAAFSVGLLGAVCGGMAKVFDDERYPTFTIDYLGKGFLDRNLPDVAVFNCFIVAISIVSSFRTAFALNRFNDGAACLHHMGTNYFETASSLMSFCRYSKASKTSIRIFQETLVRLLSLMHALCLESLEGADDKQTKPNMVHTYELIDMEPLDQWFQEFVLSRGETKIEAIFQAIQELIMANMNNGVLDVPPALVTRSFTELGNGLVKFHDGMKVTNEKTPLAYNIVTVMILVSSAFFVPAMLANCTRGVLGASCISFGFVFAVWFIYGIADSLDNPYSVAAHTINTPRAQKELNDALLQLLWVREAPVPSVDLGMVDRNKKQFKLRSLTLSRWRAEAEAEGRADPSLSWSRRWSTASTADGAGAAAGSEASVSAWASTGSFGWERFEEPGVMTAKAPPAPPHLPGAPGGGRGPVRAAKPAEAPEVPPEPALPGMPEIDVRQAAGPAIGAPALPRLPGAPEGRAASAPVLEARPIVRRQTLPLGAIPGAQHERRHSAPLGRAVSTKGRDSRKGTWTSGLLQAAGPEGWLEPPGSPSQRLERPWVDNRPHDAAAHPRSNGVDAHLEAGLAAAHGRNGPVLP